MTREDAVTSEQLLYLSVLLGRAEEIALKLANRTQEETANELHLMIHLAGKQFELADVKLSRLYHLKPATPAVSVEEAYGE